MSNRLHSVVRLLALLIVLTSVLTGCGKRDDSDDTAQQAVAEATAFSTKTPSEQMTSMSDPTLTTEPSAALMVVPSSLETESYAIPAISPTATQTAAPTYEPDATPTVVSSSVVNGTDAPRVSATPKALTEGEASKEPAEGMFDPWFAAKTSIAYSSGTDSEWAYGNQRKEFTSSKPCYVRVSSSIVARWHWGWRYGEGNKIAITYRFTGAEQCIISISDGFVTEVETDDSSVIEFTRTIDAKGSEVEDVVVFQYTPKGIGSVSLEVIYDDQVKSQYDERNTVYFINEEDW